MEQWVGLADENVYSGCSSLAANYHHVCCKSGQSEKSGPIFSELLCVQQQGRSRQNPSRFISMVRWSGA